MMAKRPKWSLKTSFVAAIVLFIAVTILVFALVEKSVWARLELITSILAGLCFIYLWAVLYAGVRFDKKERYEFRWVGWKPVEWAAQTPADTGGIFTGAGAEAGPLGCLAGFLLDIVVSLLITILLAFLFWLGANILMTAVIAIFIPLFFLFRRSLRIVAARGRRCRGDLRKSFAYALVYTALNAVWFYAILFAAHYIAFKTGMKA